MASIRRTSLNLDFDLVERAREELGTNGTTDTVNRALDEVVRRAAIERLLAIRFGEFEDPEVLDKARREWWGQ